MNLLAVIGVAFALAADAFAVSVSVGLALGQVTGRQLFRLSWHFGLFQFLMPVVGWTAGRTVREHIQEIDHWLALALLAYIGGKMICESLSGGEKESASDPTRGLSLVMLSTATSIDALAVGLTLALLDVPILVPCLVIGLVAGGMTILGMMLGRRIGSLFSRRVEAVGGAILILIGVHIVLEHLGVL